MGNKEGSLTTETRYPAVVEKSYRIHREGCEKLWRGEMRPFTGVPPEIADRFTVAAVFDNCGSERGATDFSRFECFLRGKERFAGKLFLADRDFRLHATIGEGTLPEARIGEREHAFHDVAKAIEMRHPDLNNLCGTRIVFNYAAFDGTNIILTSLQPPQNLPQVREKLAAICRECGLTPIVIENLFHITAARLMSPVARERREAFIEMVEELQWALTQAPLTLTVARILARPTIGVMWTPYRK